MLETAWAVKGRGRRDCSQGRFRRLQRRTGRRMNPKRGSGGTEPKQFRVATDPRTEQSPEDGGTSLAPVGNCRQEAGLNARRATADDESVRLFAGQNP